MRGLQFVFLSFSVLATFPSLASDIIQRPDDIVELRLVAPDIAQDMRYATNHNFIGRPIDGYEKPTCILTRNAAEALKAGQKELQQQGLSFIVYDCYRPTRAVSDFVQWSQKPDEQTMKAEFYPNVDKEHFFKLGYVATRSGHSRGSTVDLAIARRNSDHTFTQLDFGSGFDFLDEQSAIAFEGVSSQAKSNRQLLARLMDKIGFKGYDKEWWHFTLRDESYPETYFDFPVR